MKRLLFCHCTESKQAFVEQITKSHCIRLFFTSECHKLETAVSGHDVDFGNAGLSPLHGRLLAVQLTSLLTEFVSTVVIQSVEHNAIHRLASEKILYFTKEKEKKKEKPENLSI